MATLCVARWVPATVAEGPHLRFALWLQGCSLRCPGCCNPELFDPAGGRDVEIETLEQAIDDAARTRHVEGITILGGEPLDQADGLVELVERVHRRGLGSIVFTGYRLAEVRRNPRAARLLESVDTLVDGRFIASLAEPRAGRAVVGSTNQTLRHFTQRYADPQLWRNQGLVEVRIGPTGAMSAHGGFQQLRELSAKLTDPP